MNRSRILRLFDSLSKTRRISAAKAWQLDVELRAAQKQLPLSGPRRNRIKRYQVESMEEYLRITKKIREECPVGFQVFFRGQSREYLLPNSDQIALLPSAGRPGVVAGRIGSRLRNSYRRYFDFLVRSHLRAAGLFRGARTSNKKMISIDSLQAFSRRLAERFWNRHTVEATLQHYGFPTLTLDVTWSPLVGLFFATHRFSRNSFGALKGISNDGTGVVYALFVPEAPSVYSSQKKDKRHSYQTSAPRYVDLFDLFLDNDTRPRRQAAALLTEAENYWFKDAPQLNVYSTYLRYVIEIPPSICKTSDRSGFFSHSAAGRFFPSSSADSLYSALIAAKQSQIVRYSLSGQSQKDPIGKFEHTIIRRVLLVGSDAALCRTLLQHTWVGRYRVEVLSIEQAIAELMGRSKKCIDIVMCCEPTIAKAAQLGQRLARTARRSSRTLMTMYSANFLGGWKKDFKPRFEIPFGKTSLPVIADSHDSDVDHQNGILDALLKVSSHRTKIWLSESSVNDFMNWNSKIRRF